MPPLSSLLAALDAYWYAFVAAVIFLGAVWRSLPVDLRDKIERSFPRIVGFVRLAIAIFPDLVNAFRAFRIQIIAGEPKRKGFSRFGVLFVCALCFVAALAVSACPMPQPDGCTPSAQRCSPAGIPQVCSQTQRWTAGALAKPCAEYGPTTTCCRTRSAYTSVEGAARFVFACVPQSSCEPEAIAVTDVLEAADAAEGGAS